MLDFIYAILGFVIAVGLLTAIHEFGHFWVARKLGIKVLRFSIGMGHKLYSWRDKSGTEYSLCALPIGGYVKMLDQTEGHVEAHEISKAFNRKPLWVRASVVLAGPIFNLIFAVCAYWFIFVWGSVSIAPVLGDIPKDTVAYSAGLRGGEEIVAIDGKSTNTWDDVVLRIAKHMGSFDRLVITAKDQGEAPKDFSISLQNTSLDSKNNILNELGIGPIDPLKPIIGEIVPESPAAKSALQPGDIITAVDGDKINNITQVLNVIRANSNQKVLLEVKRGTNTQEITITPIRKDDMPGNIGYIGVTFAPQVFPEHLIRIARYAPLPALGMAIEKTANYATLTLQFLGKMVQGKISMQHLSGPISIAQYAGQTVRTGVDNFINFLALISISLGVINLLPIPVLDGGHLLFCIIEAVRGKELSARTNMLCQVFGITVIGMMMVVAIYNDVLRLVKF